MTALQWYQVHAWRMSQHGLSPRFSSQDVVRAVTRTAGIQAQVMSAAELALCMRVEELSPRDVQSASLAGPRPGEDLGDAWHLTRTRGIRPSSVCGCA